jgi:hypothetical protein
MTKQEIISLALSGYPGGDDTNGDTLALFIERELSDTYESDRPDAIQLSIASHGLQRATENLLDAMAPVYRRLRLETNIRMAA